MGSERDECGWHERLVEHVEFYDDHRDANSFVADERRDEPADITHSELERGNGCGDV